MRQRHFSAGKKNPRQYSLLKKVLFSALLLSIIMTLLGTSFLYYVLLKEIPSIAALKDYRPSIATRVYADNNELIDEFFAEDRKLVKVSELPKRVIMAFVAAEDARFFQHQGLDLHSITRAF